MTHPFFVQTFVGDRADALIAQVKAGLGERLMQGNFAILMADEACGQALIDRCAEWVRQELGSPQVWVLPTLGHEGANARIELLVGQIPARGFGPMDDWSFDALAQQFGGEGGACLLTLDPRTPFAPQRLQMLQEASGAYLMGGVSAPSGSYQGPTGVCLGLDAPLIHHTFQGVERLNTDHKITAAEGQIICEIDGRPALSVLKEVAGDILSRKMDQLPNFIFPIFPVSDASPDDFLVRRISGLGQQKQVFSVVDEVLPGMPLSFARRNGAFVRETLMAGMAALATRAGTAPRAAIYLHDARRSLDFTNPGGEVALVREAMGTVPLICGAVNGLVSHNRLYHLTSQLIFIL